MSDLESACLHRNWYCAVGQPAICTDCGKSIRNQIPPPDPPPHLRIVK